MSKNKILNKQSEKGITLKKEENFSEWFTQLIIKADLVDYSSVSGCIILKPSAYSLWEKLQKACDKEFKKISIQNVYFPLFISENSFQKEAEHVEGFAPEVAWVTQAGNKKLNEKLAIRPTSEAIMYESYSKWIRSWRDLPLRYNQWNNVVRWEFKNPVPFFRTREFLWNEGHTIFATEKEAMKEREEILGIYDKVCREILALPGIIGRKTDKEKFAGAVFSDKIHYALQNGKIIEGPCFHHDGQNFSKAYDIKFLDKQEKEQYAWQNTWAITTRMIGTMLAIHSDNKGLIIPPSIAENKIVIVPILFEKTKKDTLRKSREIKKILNKFNPLLDERESYSPGWKFNEWELKGIPLRVEIGPKDLEKNKIIVVKRNDSKKIEISINELGEKIPEILDEIQKELFKSAEKILRKSIKEIESPEELKKVYTEKKMFLVPLSKDNDTEDKLKERFGLKTLFINPKEKSIENKKCIITGKSADYWVYIGRTY